MTNCESYWELLRKYTPNGTQTNSKRPSVYVEGVYPKVLAWGNGGRVYDADGNEYVDLISGLGAVSVGYSNSQVNRKVISQVVRGVSFSLPTALEYLVAKKLCELVPSTEMWKFTKTGSDACTMAVKCARAYTGRRNVLSSGYHGWHDWYSILNDKRAGIAGTVETEQAKYNDIASFHKILDEQYACVIIEPATFESPTEGFLETLREWCTQSGTLLIFDEVITGGRYTQFAAQNNFKINPDLTILSKGIANGYPLAAVGGGRGVMSTFERNDFFASTTFGGECVSLAACLETADILKNYVYRMFYNGTRIKEYFNSLFFDTKAICKGYPTRLTFDFPTPEHKGLFMQEMCLNGVLIGHSNFIMVDHTEGDMTKVFEAILKSKDVLVKNWSNPAQVMKGEVPVETLRMR